MTEQSQQNKTKNTMKELRDSMMSLTIGVPVAIAESVDVLVKKATAIGRGTVTSFQCATTGNHGTLEEAEGLVASRFETIKSEHPNAYVAVQVNQPSRIGAYHAVTAQVTVAHSY
jgi:acetyltransferase-like isoleucine patch superfamily enzyme